MTSIGCASSATACTLVALGAVASLRSSVPAQPVDGNGFAQLTGGIAYLRSHRLVLWLEGVLLIAMTGVLGVETLLPVFAAGTWHTGSFGYGLLRMAPGVAALLALACLLFSAAGRGALTIGIAFAGGRRRMAFAAGPSVRRYPSSSWPARHLCLAVTQVIAGAMIQQAIPDALRGRISALGSAGQNGLAGLGAVATSGLAATVGPGAAVIGLAGNHRLRGVSSSPCSSHVPRPAHRTRQPPASRPASPAEPSPRPAHARA